MASRRKTRGLPDLRQRGYSFPEAPGRDGKTPRPPSLAELETIAKRHGIRAHKSFAKDFDDRWYWWRADSAEQADSVPPAERVRFLRELAQCADSLWDAMNKAGYRERTAIQKSQPPARFDWDALKEGVSDLRLAASVGSKLLPTTIRGRRADAATLNLVAALWRTYRHAHGASSPKISRHDQYGGPFFDFADEVLRAFGVRKTNTALGKLIENVQAKVRANDLTRRSPK